MAVVTLNTPIGVSNPEARKRMILKELDHIGDKLALLQCVADSASMSQADDEIHRSLYVLHDDIKKGIDTIAALT